MRQAVASVRILKLPHIHAEAVRVEVDCRYGTTGVTSVSGPQWTLTERQQITMAVYAHEVRCGECDTSQAHDRGDQTIREQTDQAWRDLIEAAGRRYAAGVRN